MSPPSSRASSKLQSARLCLRPWTDADAPALAPILGDPEVMRFSYYGPMEDSERRAWLARQMAVPMDPDGPLGSWAVSDRAEGHVMGYVRLSRTDQCHAPGDAELGIRLAPSFWGKGYGKEAVETLVDRARAGGSVKRLLAMVDPANDRSVALQRALGLAFEAEVMLPGYDHPDHLYTRAL